MFAKSLVLLAIMGILSLVSSQDVDYHSMGLGRKRVEKHHRNYHYGLQAKEKPSGCEDVEALYFKDAVIDNFAPITKYKKWEGSPGQRYWVNRKFYAGNNAPIFVFIGGEGTEACGRIGGPSMLMYQLAEEHNALLVDVEHRFYGKSLPTKDVSTHNLQYLSSDQALADLARIVTAIKKDYNSPHSKVVTFGGSYPGNLAAWFRLKYPSITSGSIASSGPLKAKSNFYEYMEVVGQSIMYFSGSTCYDAFTEASNKVAKLASEGPGSTGMATLEADFNTCAPIGNDLDLATFYSNVMGNVQGTVQYNNEKAGVLNVTDICDAMTDTSNDAYSNFVSLSKRFTREMGEECEDISYKATIDYLADTSVPSDLNDPSSASALNAARSWIYQTCNEFGYYQTTDSKQQPFYGMKELNLDYYYKMCHDMFDGWNAEPNTEFTNTKYGNTHIDSTSTVFTAGTIDPWHALGVTNYTSTLKEYPSDIPVYILGTAHCEDMHSPSSDDPESLTYARKIVAENVAKWLATDSA